VTLATVTLSSVGTSPVVNLNWIGGKPVLMNIVSSAATSSGSVVIQYSLDDPQRTASSLASWFGVSSQTYSVEAAAGTVYSASAIFPDGIFLPLPISPCAVRMNSSALSQGFTMRVVQGEGW
jgi:hypothetical protein